MDTIVSAPNATMLHISLNSSSASRSLTPSPSRELRGIRLFRVISRRLARRQQPESRSSSSDSDSSSPKKPDSGFQSPTRASSSSGSDTGSDIVRHHHSTSAESIRKVFQSLAIAARSQSCSNAKEAPRKKAAPKRILRSPVAYTYVRGLSGLPTQRVPKTRTGLNGPCGCSMQYMAGLNR